MQRSGHLPLLHSYQTVLGEENKEGRRSPGYQHKSRALKGGSQGAEVWSGWHPGDSGAAHL